MMPRFERPKETWGDGPWQTEPDHAEFRHAGFPCILHRNKVGAWCGYVGVPPGHPWHGLGYDQVHEMESELSVHGGLKYADACQGDICHKPAPGEPDDVWWLGFDCAHVGDFLPVVAALVGRGPRMGELYKTIHYVRAETERLAEQAKAAAP